MEAQELELWRAQTQQSEMLEPENRDVDSRHVEPPESMAAETDALEAAADETPAVEHAPVMQTQMRNMCALWKRRRVTSSPRKTRRSLRRSAS
jgi:hypothetical protein